jgi:hypothetical protein
LKRLITILVFLALAGTTQVEAQDTDSDEWQFQLAPLYLWAASIGGTMDLRGEMDHEIQVDFNDAVDNLQAAFTIHFEARKGHWGILADANYMSFSGSQEIGTPAESADLKVKELLLEAAGGYEFSHQWWVIAGVRYLKLDPKVTFQVLPEIDPSESITDLFAGLMWRPKLGNKWTFSARFDIGAGGSDLVWNAAAVLDYRLGPWAAVFAGYRHLDYDYKNQDTGFAYDASLSGPVAAFRFFW